MIPTGALRFDGFPGGHADFGRGNPSLSEKALDRVVITKVPFASFGPDVVEDEAPQNVQGLPWKGESARVVGQVPGLVFLSFASLLAQEGFGTREKTDKAAHMRVLTDGQTDGRTDRRTD